MNDAKDETKIFTACDPNSIYVRGWKLASDANEEMNIEYSKLKIDIADVNQKYPQHHQVPLTLQNADGKEELKSAYKRALESNESQTEEKVCMYEPANFYKAQGIPEYAEVSSSLSFDHSSPESPQREDASNFHCSFSEYSEDFANK